MSNVLEFKPKIGWKQFFNKMDKLELLDQFILFRETQNYEKEKAKAMLQCLRDCSETIEMYLLCITCLDELDFK